MREIYRVENFQNPKFTSVSLNYQTNLNMPIHDVENKYFMQYSFELGRTYRLISRIFC